MAHLDEIYITSTHLIPWITFLIALGGSAHCVGMCGGLVMAFTDNRKTNIFYQIGRLWAYLTLGLIASFLGESIRGTFQSSELTLLTTIFMSALLIYWGVKLLLKDKLKLRLPNIFGRLTKKFYSIAYSQKLQNESLRSSLLGFLSIFLPCGFLYGVVFVVATFNNPILGIVSMFTFWLGTIPAISMAPDLLKRILIPLKAKAPILSSIALISLGLITLSTRVYAYYTTGTCH